MTKRFTFSVYVRLARLHTLTAAVLPVLAGAALVWRRQGTLHVDTLIAVLAVGLLMQVATNMFNEYYDYLRGVDNEQSMGIGGAITQDNLPPWTVLAAALGTLALAALPGLYLCVKGGWWLLAAGMASALAGYLYTGGPWPISATPWGELVSGGVMGAGLFLLSCYFQAGAVRAADALVSVPFVLLTAAILTANNLRDIVNDAKAGRRTLVILMGRRRGLWFLAGLMAAAHLWLVGLTAAGLLPATALLALGGLAPAAAAIAGFVAAQTMAHNMEAMKRVAVTHTVFSFLLVLGLLLRL